LPALSSAIISSVEARVFGIALYFKLRTYLLFRPTPISRVSDDRSLGSEFQSSGQPLKIGNAF